MRDSIGAILRPGSGGRKGRLRVAEGGLVVALLLMAAIAWSPFSPLPFAAGLRFVLVAAGLAAVALLLGEQPGGVRYWLRELLPTPFIPYTFLSLGVLIPSVNPRVADALLMGWDERLLGRELQTALYSMPLPSWSVDILSLAYSSFFFLPLTLVVVLAWRRDPQIARVSATIVLTFMVSYTGYFLVPAYGPRTTVAKHRWESLPHGLVGGRLRMLLDEMESTKTDAFPSGHTMVTLATLLCARRRARDVFDALLPMGSLLIAATVLLTYHYLVDLLAAVPFLVASWWLSAWLAGPVSPRVASEPSSA
ncbi:MAG TPA: phosphatase PAP2 family protein [Thermoanaerobaculaceae bacterium]|nr:phosphatase PAP2 family protein [Thermoanaerobaculaceae bacterium]